MGYTNKVQNIISLMLGLSVLVLLTLFTTTITVAEENISAHQDGSSINQRQARASLGVSRHWSASMSNGDADSIFYEGSVVLQQYDGPGDVACNVTLRRSGDVSTFNVGDGSIDSRRDFNDVLNASGFVKVVNTINWCGKLSPNIIGCAPVPGNGMVVIRYSNEGILWAHEYGHTRGLHHSDSQTAVMYGSIGSDHRRVTASECSYFRN